jgi:hypothetical protein
MRVRVVRDRDGKAIAAAVLEPVNPDGAVIEPVLEEGQTLEDVQVTRSELLDPQSFLQQQSQTG